MARTEASYWTGLTFVVCFCFLLQQLKLKLKLMLNAFSSYLEEVKLMATGCSTTAILVIFVVYFLKGKQHFGSFVELKAFSAFCCCSCWWTFPKVKEAQPMRRTSKHLD